MRIENHKLTDPVEGVELTHREGMPSKYYAKFARGNPEIVVVHYAVTDSIDATYRAMNYRDYWAHLTIDGFTDDRFNALSVQQHLPFNKPGSHAGRSSYKGRPSVNRFSIGIEIANPGPLVEKGYDHLETTWGQRWYGSASQMRHRLGSPWDWWADYAPAEIDGVIHLCLLLKKQYGIVDVVGHDEITDRKRDPGPAFPIDHVRQMVFPENY